MKTTWIVLAVTVTLLVTVSSARADFAAGLTAYQKGDYETAFKEWQPLAESGGPDAQFNLALMYEGGQGVPRNYEEAARWFMRAANQGHVRAQHNLGAMYGIGQGVRRDYIQAYKWLSLCAAKGGSGCASQRDQIEKKLKPSKLAEAQRLTGEWQPKEETPPPAQ